jgi:hypothetical protein
MSQRLALSDRRHHLTLTQKMNIAHLRTLYLSMPDYEQPAEVFLRVKGLDCFSELIGLDHVIARLMSLAVQYGPRLAKVGNLLAGAKIASYSPVVGYARIKHCSSLPDLTSRHLLAKCCGRHELIMFQLQQRWTPHTISGGRC